MIASMLVWYYLFSVVVVVANESVVSCCVTVDGVLGQCVKMSIS